ncbi:MAG: SH3 domain-containing protein [Anaerolineales bacterium]|nr:SH3 domain-containing protein [Anaerolineales bacterium]
MAPRRSPFDWLAWLLNLATLGVVGLVAAVFLNPALVPPAWRPISGQAPPPTAVAFVPETASATATQPVVFPTLPPEWTATPTLEFPPTETPDRYPTFTPSGGPAPTLLPNLNSTAEAGVDGRVVADAGFLRVRALAGTAGEIIGNLSPNTAVRIIGRSEQSDWLEVIGPDDLRGWVMAPFVDVYINLLAVPVTAGAVLDATATPVIPDEAKVSDAGDNLRLRASPGTAGAIIGNLPAGMVLDLVGRTADSAWLQVLTADNRSGWVMARYVDLYMDVGKLPVTGVPVDAAGTAPPSGGQPATTVVVAFLPSATSTASKTLVPPTPVPPTATHTPPPTPTNTNPPPPPPPSEVIFGISQHSRDLYLYGQSLGNHANVFAKIGDSLTVAPQFLLPIGYGAYNLRDYSGLQEAVNFFGAGQARIGNPFVNTSLAAKGGWSSFSLVAGSTSNKTYCGNNESPVQCELRLNRPAIALILIGTNDLTSSTAEGYQANLRRIVADCVSQGVIPVLSTLPPYLRAGYEGYAGRVAEFNGYIIAIAQENDLPVWNLWAAVQSLPNRGLGGDGVHLSVAPDAADFTAANLQYGSTVRNLTALQLLDALWRGVMQ